MAANKAKALAEGEQDTPSLFESCAKCELKLPKTRFSKTQLKKNKGVRKCDVCVKALMAGGKKVSVQTAPEKPAAAAAAKPDIAPVTVLFGPTPRPANSVIAPSSDTDGSSTDGTDSGSVDAANKSAKSGLKKETLQPMKRTLADCRVRLAQIYDQECLNPVRVEKRIAKTLARIPTVTRLVNLIARKYGWEGVTPVEKQQKEEVATPKKIGKKRKRAEEEEDVAETAKSGGNALVCDKCDGKHLTSKCPYYKKAREDHPDAQRRRGIVNLGGDGGNVIVRTHQARVVRQPGDGSCLYHSLRFGLGATAPGIHSTHALRQTLANWVRTHKEDKIADTPVREWVRWDAGCSVESYANRMRSSAWGGGIELAACARHFGVLVHVWERHHGGYKRISSFQSPTTPKKTVNIIYQGGMHYDYIEINGNSEKAKGTSGGGRTLNTFMKNQNVFKARSNFMNSNSQRNNNQRNNKFEKHFKKRARWGRF